MKYTLSVSNSQSETTTPVLVVEADGIDAVPTSVRPYEHGNDLQVSLASRLLESITDHPDDNTLGQIAVSFGGMTSEEGEEF